MKTLLFLLFSFSISNSIFSQYQAYPYLDQNGIECVLLWNTSNGQSTLMFYSSEEKKFLPASYQLPTRPTGESGVHQFHPYLDQNGYECVLAWNEVTGTSKLYFYSSDHQEFVLANYQLPSNPTGDSGSYSFHPYLDQNGLECVLVTNMRTGTTKLYFYSSTTKSFALASYQLVSGK